MVDAEVETVGMICYCRPDAGLAVCILKGVALDSAQCVTSGDVVEVAAHHHASADGVKHISHHLCLNSTLAECVGELVNE